MGSCPASPLPLPAARVPTLSPAPVCRLQGGYKFHQYQVVGRLKPSAQKGTRKSTIYKMNVFAPNSVVAKSRFWYYMSMLNRVKRANGEILQINEVTAGSHTARCCARGSAHPRACCMQPARLRSRGTH